MRVDGKSWERSGLTGGVGTRGVGRGGRTTDMTESRDSVISATRQGGIGKGKEARDEQRGLWLHIHKT